MHAARNPNWIASRMRLSPGAQKHRKNLFEKPE